jgi:hypothetical protein
LGLNSGHNFLVFFLKQISMQPLLSTFLANGGGGGGGGGVQTVFFLDS